MNKCDDVYQGWKVRDPNLFYISFFLILHRLSYMIWDTIWYDAFQRHTFFQTDEYIKKRNQSLTCDWDKDLLISHRVFRITSDTSKPRWLLLEVTGNTMTDDTRHTQLAFFTIHAYTYKLIYSLSTMTEIINRIRWVNIQLYQLYH